MNSEKTPVEKSNQILDIWTLRGREMRHILRAACITHERFGKMYGRSVCTIRTYFDKPVVKPAWRDRLISVVGDEFYFRELLAIRETHGTACDSLRDHVHALNERRKKRPQE